MKLCLSLAAAFLLIGIAANAQEKVRYGLKAGVNMANYDAKVSVVGLDTKSVPSFYVTAFADVSLGNTAFSLQPGVSFQGKGAKLSGSFPNPLSSSWPAQTVKATYTERPYWIETPVNLIGRMDLGSTSKFFVGAGPYVAFGVGGEYKIKTAGASFVDMLGVGGDLDFGSDGELKSTDFGINFLAGVEMGNGVGLQAGFGLGLTDIGGSKLFLPFNQKNRVFSIGLSKTF